jgi:threonine dehydrogenase-like Zn-dependent dehydrogenase
MAARLARLREAGWVGITGLAADNEREKARFAVARQLGCDRLVEAGRDEVAVAVKSRFPAGVDRVIVSSPPESLADAFQAIRFGGIITFFGLHFGGRSRPSTSPWPTGSSPTGWWTPKPWSRTPNAAQDRGRQPAGRQGGHAACRDVPQIVHFQSHGQ